MINNWKLANNEDQREKGLEELLVRFAGAGDLAHHALCSAPCPLLHAHVPPRDPERHGPRPGSSAASRSAAVAATHPPERRSKFKTPAT